MKILNTFKSFPILAILERMTATEIHSIIKSIQSITNNKQPQITNKSPNEINRYPYYQIPILSKLSKLSISSPKPVKYIFPSQCIPQSLSAYAMHVWLTCISDITSDIPTMHPPSIRRACISYREFTGNMRIMEGRKDDT